MSQDSQSNVYRAIVDANRRKILGLLREVDEWLGRCRELWEDRLDRLGEVVAAAAAADRSKTEKGAGR